MLIQKGIKNLLQWALKKTNPKRVIFFLIEGLKVEFLGCTLRISGSLFLPLFSLRFSFFTLRGYTGLAGLI